MEQVWAPIAGILIATLPAALTYYFTKRSQLRADESRLKEKYYLSYIKALSNNVLSDNLDESKSMLSDARNHILLIGSSDVVARLINFSDYISPDRKEPYSQEKHDMLLTELIKSMRDDLYEKDKINQNYPTVSLSGKRKIKEGQMHE